MALNNAKVVSYQASNTYDTMNKLTEHTKNVWLVFHGIGYLSRFFIQHFKSLDATENYIIAPQAPSKFYKGSDYKSVGSSWLTKENTQIDTKSVLNYVDALMDTEKLPEHCKFIVLGYSQGVSIAARWVATRQISCDSLVFVSGGFPKELTTKHFSFLKEHTKLTYVLGDNDPYFDPVKVAAEKIRIKEMLPRMQFQIHDGGHELNLNTFLEVI